MHTSTLPLAALLSLPPFTNAIYTLENDFHASSIDFFDNFRFWHEGPDPTNGFTQYVDRETANASGLIRHENYQVYLGVDHDTVLPFPGKINRSSVRIEALFNYIHGLFTADIAHQPGGICGTWPAWWMFGNESLTTPPCSQTGEIDMIENINMRTNNTSTLWAYQAVSATPLTTAIKCRGF